MKLDEIIKSHFHFLLADGLFRITEIHTDDDSEVFAIVRGKKIAFLFSVENGRQLLAVTPVYYARWCDIRDIYCILDDTYKPTNNEDFESLAVILQGNIDRIECIFKASVWLDTLNQLGHYMSCNALVRAATVDSGPSCGLYSLDELEQLVRTEFDFLLQNGRYMIVKPDDDGLPDLELRGPRIKFYLALDRECDLLEVGPLSSSNLYSIWMVRSLYEKNFDELSLMTFKQWQRILRKEIGQIESLFDKRNLSSTVKTLKKMGDDYEKEFLRSEL